MIFTADNKQRLDKFLASQIPEVSRGKIQKAIKDGLVLVNGEKVLETDFQVTENDKIELPEFNEDRLEILNFSPAGEAGELKIIFENQDLVVIDKPAGLVVHPAAGHKQDTLVNVLIGKFPEIKTVGPATRPGIVHRLDEDTSGLLVVAKNTQSFDYLKSLFQDRKIEKEYLALVHGVPEKLHGFIDEPIGKSSTHQKMKIGVGRDAKTEYSLLASTRPTSLGEARPIENGAAGQFSLLRVKLHTGRTHQIRVHLAHIGHPIFGDQLYGGHNKLPDSQILSRQFLHAFRLKLQMMDGTWLEVESELPPELQTVLNNLRINYKLRI